MVRISAREGGAGQRSDLNAETDLTMGGDIMLIADILNSCAHESVAEAAIGSIGGDFADRLRTLATRCDLSAGELAGKLVRRFAIDATERDWRQVTAAMDGKDMPLLCGLRAIISSMMRNPSTAVYLATLASEAGDADPVWAVGPNMTVLSPSA